MERATPVRKPNTSTADLLTWSETPMSPAEMEAMTPARKTNKPAGGITAVMFGAQMSEEEAESVLKREPCSTSKLKEFTGSGIFAGDAENGETEPGNSSVNPSNKTGLRIYQQAVATISHISFTAEESVSPKKPITMSEVAKQRELSGTLDSEEDAKMKKQLSDAKYKELGGHDIFGPPPEIPSRPLAPRNLELKGQIDFGEPDPPVKTTPAKAYNQNNVLLGEESDIKTAKKICNKKFAELTGNDIFKGDTPPGSAEKHLSMAKLREISGSDIFADGKASAREYFGGVRKPPGGESSIALV